MNNNNFRNQTLISANLRTNKPGTLPEESSSEGCTTMSSIRMTVYTLFIITAMGVFTPGAYAVNLLFKSSFGPGVTLSSPQIPNNKMAWQHISGTDQETGFSWPIEALGAKHTSIQMITSDPISDSTLGDYASNKITKIIGPDGNLINALNQNIYIKGSAGTWGAQSPLVVVRPWTIGDTGDMYITYWFKHPEDLAERLDNTVSGGASIVQFQFKTGGYQNTWKGDYRINTVIVKNPEDRLIWNTYGDNQANAGFKKETYWSIFNDNVEVPVGKWFKFEIFIHRSNGNDGRYWVAVNGQIIADHRGSNMGVFNLPINRIMLTSNYSGGYAPISGNMTSLEIWDGFPCGEGLPCYGRCVE